jgi:hypothetical protein
MCIVRRSLVGAVACVLFVFAGCSKGRKGVSEYQVMRDEQEKVASQLRDKGMVVESRKYPQGDAWAITLKDAEINDEVFGRMKKVGHITELDLSGSTITDDQMAKINDMEVGALLLILDLSNTQISDAGLDKVEDLLLLRTLRLKGTKVTDEGVQRFLDKRQSNKKIPGNFKRPDVER